MSSASQDEDNPFPSGSESLSLLLDGKETPITFRIIRAFTPFTQGQVYLVDGQGFPESPLTLKVYDPKFLNDRQPSLYTPHRPWLLAVESLVAGKRLNGEISDNFEVHHLDDNVELEPWHWEAQFFCWSEESFEAEVMAYIQEVGSNAGPVYSKVIWAWKTTTHSANIPRNRARGNTHRVHLRPDTT